MNPPHLVRWTWETLQRNYAEGGASSTLGLYQFKKKENAPQRATKPYCGWGSGTSGLISVPEPKTRGLIRDKLGATGTGGQTNETRGIVINFSTLVFFSVPTVNVIL